MGRPAGMGDGDLLDGGPFHVHLRRCDLLAETGDFANFFEIHDFAFLVAVDGEASGVVAPILLTGEAIAQDL